MHVPWFNALPPHPKLLLHMYPISQGLGWRCPGEWGGELDSMGRLEMDMMVIRGNQKKENWEEYLEKNQLSATIWLASNRPMCGDL